jgi:hypothetical protein
MPESGGFQLVVETHRVVTSGLAPIDWPELAIEVTSPAEIDAAKRVLLRLAGYIVSTNARVAPGGRFDLDGQTITLDDAGDGVLAIRTGRRHRRASHP